MMSGFFWMTLGLLLAAEEFREKHVSCSLVAVMPKQHSSAIHDKTVVPGLVRIVRFLTII